jgi:hypothetical protein
MNIDKLYINCSKITGFYIENISIYKYISKYILFIIYFF